MDKFKLHLLIFRLQKRLNLIMEGYRLSASYANNPDLPIHLKEERAGQLSLYRHALLEEFKLAKTILLENMEGGASCLE